jgi:hypothetical protein
MEVTFREKREICHCQRELILHYPYLRDSETLQCPLCSVVSPSLSPWEDLQNPTPGCLRQISSEGSLVEGECTQRKVLGGLQLHSHSTAVLFIQRIHPSYFKSEEGRTRIGPSALQLPASLIFLTFSQQTFAALVMKCPHFISRFL